MKSHRVRFICQKQDYGEGSDTDNTSMAMRDKRCRQCMRAVYSFLIAFGQTQVDAID